MFAAVCTIFCRVAKPDKDRLRTFDKLESNLFRALNRDTDMPGLSFAAQLRNDVVAAR